MLLTLPWKPEPVSTRQNFRSLMQLPARPVSIPRILARSPEFVWRMMRNTSNLRLTMTPCEIG